MIAEVLAALAFFVAPGVGLLAWQTLEDYQEKRRWEIDSKALSEQRWHLPTHQPA